MKKINILNLDTAFAMGGAEKVILDLMNNLDDKLFNTSIIALAEHTDMLGEFLDNGLKAEKLDMKKGFGETVRVLKYLDRYIIDNKIDIIHAHLFHPLPIASLLKIKHPKLKIVFTSHNIDIGGKAREVLTWLLKPFRNTDVVFSESMITRMYKKDTVVIANGIDLSKFDLEVPKNEKFTFISVATLRPEKNHIFLVGCAKKLKEKGLDFELQIVGGGDENQAVIDEMKAEIEKQDVGDCVKMLGVRNDIPELLLKAHCKVLPSFVEGMPIALLEAGATKLPIISTPVGAIPSMIDETNGYLTPLETFCETMEEVYSNQDEANKRAAKLSNKVIEKYSIQGMAAAHTKVYQRLMKT
jgi:glycosyltransferase involved in cell wall biosynthesis